MPINIYSNPVAIVYKIICTITGKYYIGKTIHIIDFLNKKYERDDTRSNSLIQRSLNKHGYDNHDFTIIAYFFNEDDAFAYEEELTPFEEIYPQNPMSLNLKTGGKGFRSGKLHPLYKKTGINHHRFGTKRPEHSKRMTGENNPMHGLIGELSPMYKNEHLISGNKHGHYNHDVSTQSIIDLIIKHTKEKGSKLTHREWYKIAKENNSLSKFISRMPEINEILKTDCKNVEDVFKYIKY